ncbi:hypothetical protein HYX00_02300 [Candidatus Woesearchaeota archaeon]|nr:hypothetical protein [Candidatus Woesearchaeota archaeon]
MNREDVKQKGLEAGNNFKLRVFFFRIVLSNHFIKNYGLIGTFERI